MSKMDLFHQRGRSSINRYLDADTQLLLNDINRSMPPRYLGLNKAIAALVQIALLLLMVGTDSTIAP